MVNKNIPPDKKTCPKCKEIMEKGTLNPSPVWVKGRPFVNWSTLKVKTNIWTYKCKKCGHLESYSE